MVRRLVKQEKPGVDKKLLFTVFILLVLGLIAVADASAPQALNTFSDKFYFVKQQAIWAVVGIILMFIMSRIKYSFWGKMAIPIFAISVLALLIVLIPGIGVKVYGARRWINLGPQPFQPSEVAKLALAIYLAKVAEKNKKVLSFFLPLVLVAVLIILEPDLGTTLIIVGIGMSEIFLSGINIFHFALASVGGILASLGLIMTSSYRRDRLFTFLKQSQDPLGKDYHIRQILLGLGSGGLLGVGLGQSRQKYLFLPEAATDSIFAVIAEEIGFIGALIIIGLFAFFIFQGLKIAKNAPDKFSQLLASGIMCWIGIQVILNIGSIVAVVPLTGIPLPFFSYGGSSLVMLLAATGILLNISRYGKKN